jgi:hypothetical protein
MKMLQKQGDQECQILILCNLRKKDRIQIIQVKILFSKMIPVSREKCKQLSQYLQASLAEETSLLVETLIRGSHHISKLWLFSRTR